MDLPCPRRGGRLYDFVFSILIPCDNNNEEPLGTLRLSESILYHRDPNKTKEIEEDQWICSTPIPIIQLIDWMQNDRISPITKQAGQGTVL